MFNFNYILFIKICILLYTKHQIYANINNKQTIPNHILLKLQSEKNTSFIYNKTGKLRCKITTKHIQYSHNTKTIYLIQPVVVLFNNTAIPIWNIKAQKAKITYNKIMYLYGNIHIINLKKNSQLQLIKTNTAILNLLTYDILSNEKTTIHGTQFYIVTTNMKGNLQKKTAELSKKVYTLYETKHPKEIQ